MKKNIYSESQRIDTIWPLTMLAVASLFNYLQYFQFGYPEMDLFYGSMVGVCAICSFLLLMKLQTEIDDEAIRFKFFPFHLKWQIIPWKDIRKTEIRTYKPIREYGGWGYRYSTKAGKAYSISGNEGIQIDMKNDTKILLGTHKMREVEQFLNEIK